jgi:hypothetical protein
MSVVLQLLIVFKTVFFMLSSEEILVMKPVIENVMKYKNQMADCIDRYRNSTIVAIIIIIIIIIIICVK